MWADAGRKWLCLTRIGGKRPELKFRPSGIRWQDAGAAGRNRQDLRISAQRHCGCGSALLTGNACGFARRLGSTAIHACIMHVAASCDAKPVDCVQFIATTDQRAAAEMHGVIIPRALHRQNSPDEAKVPVIKSILTVFAALLMMRRDVGAYRAIADNAKTPLLTLQHHMEIFPSSSAIHRLITIPNCKKIYA
jgi:hypothetical protein